MTLAEAGVIFIWLLLIKRAVCGAGAIVLSFLIHSESIPGRGAEYLLLGNVMHTYGNAEN